MWADFLDAETRTYHPNEWKRRLHSYWSILMSNLLLQNLLSWKVEIPKEQLSFVFGNQTEAFTTKYKPNNEGIWEVTIDDLPKIAMLFGEEPFVHLQLKFIGYIKTKSLTLTNILPVTFIGMKLFNFTNEPDSKQTGRIGSEKEPYFSTYFAQYYSSVYQMGKPNSLIRKDAYLTEEGRTDLILYKNTSDCVLIEWAVNLDVENLKKKHKEEKGTIIEHINRLIHIYADKDVIFYRDLGKEKQEKAKIPLSQMWFVYFDIDANILKEVESIVKDTKEYHQINMILCHYTSKRSEFGNRYGYIVEFRVKLHREKVFKKYPY